MPQQPQSNLAFFDNANPPQEFSVVLRGYDRTQVDDAVQRLATNLNKAEMARVEAEQRLNEAQRRLRQAEQRISTVEQKLTDSTKQLEENRKPTLSGLGTRVEQILRLAEEQANDHRGDAKRESEGILSAARLEARERRLRYASRPAARPTAYAPMPSARPSSCAPRPRTRWPS